MPLISTFGSAGSQSYGTRGIQVGGSAFFNGGGDALTTAPNNAFVYGSGDFTIEMWVYPLNFADYRFLWQQTSTTRDTRFWIYTNVNTGQLIYVNGVNVNAITTNGLTLNAWNHVALVRNSSSSRFFLNGVGYSSASDFRNYNTDATGVCIGKLSSVSDLYPWSGNITNVRVTKQAIYTSNFIPSGPLSRNSQNSTTTQLLLNVRSPSTLTTDSGPNNITVNNIGTVTYSALTPFNAPFVTPPVVVVTSAVVTPSTTTPSEGTTITVNVVGTNTSNGTYFYSLEEELATGALTSADFTSGSLTGSFTISGNTGSFPLTVTRDLLTEGTETFTIYVRTGSTSGPIIGASSEIAIQDTSITPVFTVTPSSIDEGSSGTFTVANVGADGTYFFTVLNGTTVNADFSVVSGSFVVSGSTGGIDNGSGSFNITPLADRVTEGSQTFQVQVRSGSVSGTVVVTSANVTVNDTSLPPAFTVTPTSINEGSSGSFTAQNLGPAGTYYWTVLNGTTTSADFSAVSGSFTTSTLNGSGSFNITPVSDSLTEGSETFQVQIRETSISGPIILTSSTITINDPTREIPIGTFTDPFGATNTPDFYVEYDPLVTNRVVASYVKDSSTCWVRAGTISDGLITWGTEVQINSGLGSFADTPHIVFDPTTSNTFMVVWSSNILTNGGSVFSRICTISGTTITIGPNTTADTGACIDTQVARPTLTSNYILTYRKNNFLYSRIATVSGTTITWGSEIPLEITNAVSGYQRLITQGDQFAVLYTANISGTPLFRYAYGSVVGGLPTWTNLGVSSGNPNYRFVVTARSVPLTSNRAFMIVSQPTAGNYLVSLTFNGTSLSFADAATLTTESHGGNPRSNLKIDPATGINAVFMYQSSGVKIQTILLDGNAGFVSSNTPILLSGGSNTSIADGIPIYGGGGRLIAWYNDNLSAGGAFRVKQIYGQA
jgi:hypothetical protein